MRGDTDRPRRARARGETPSDRARPARTPARDRGRDRLALRHSRCGEHLDPARRPLRRARAARRDRLLPQRPVGARRSVLPAHRGPPRCQPARELRHPNAGRDPPAGRLAGEPPPAPAGRARLRLVAGRAIAGACDAVRRRGR